MLNKICSLSILILFSCVTSVSASMFYNEEEIVQARSFGSGAVKIEHFFQESPQAMWMSISNQEYQYTSQRQGNFHHEQAIIVKIKKQIGTFGCDMWGELALFPNDEGSMKQIYKSPAPEFHDCFGTPFNCYIKFYGNTEHNFLVLDFIGTGAWQNGKGFPQFATDAFINFAKNHTNAQYILCDPRNPIYRHISEKFGFVLDKENELWRHFKKGVQQHYILDLTK